MRRIAATIFLLSLLVLAPLTANAQTLGQFRWQLQPYCNVLTLTITNQNGVYTLDGFDDRCGAGQRASVIGTAFLNPDGTVGFGLTIVAPDASPSQLHARVDVTSIGGPWQDSSGNSGTLVFTPGAGSGGPARPVPVNGLPPASITTPQIAPGAVTAGQLALGSITVDHLAASARSISGSTTLTNADFVNSTVWLTTGPGAASGWSARVAVIAVPALTQDVIDRGAVQVVARLYASGSEWGPLPYELAMGTGTSGYSRRIDVRYTVGAIKLYYTLKYHDPEAAPPSVYSLTLPDLPVRWTIRPPGM